MNTKDALGEYQLNMTSYLGTLEIVVLNEEVAPQKDDQSTADENTLLSEQIHKWFEGRKFLHWSEAGTVDFGFSIKAEDTYGIHTYAVEELMAVLKELTEKFPSASVGGVVVFTDVKNDPVGGVITVDQHNKSIRVDLTSEHGYQRRDHYKW